MVRAVLHDYRTAAIPEKDRVLFALLDKANREANAVTREDVDAVRSMGWTDEAIYDAITVVALFRFYNLWVDATGVHEMPATAHELSGKRLATNGYATPDD